MEKMNQALFNDDLIDGPRESAYVAGTGCVLTNTATPFCSVVGGCDTDTDSLCTP